MRLRLFLVHSTSSSVKLVPGGFNKCFRAIKTSGTESKLVSVSKDIVLICLYVDDGYALGVKANLLAFFEDLKKQVNITIDETMGNYVQEL